MTRITHFSVVNKIDHALLAAIKILVTSSQKDHEHLLKRNIQVVCIFNVFAVDAPCQSILLFVRQGQRSGRK